MADSKQSWAILLRMPWGMLLSDEAIKGGRDIIGVAEAAYAAWLGAYEKIRPGTH